VNDVRLQQAAPRTAARSRGWHRRSHPSAVLRHPNDWPDAQRAFREAVESSSHIAPERAVIAVWWRPATGPRGEVMIACYDPADISGEQPLVVFPADAPHPEEEGTSPAQLIGEVGLNATCCLRLHGSLVWPSYNRSRTCHTRRRMIDRRVICAAVLGWRQPQWWSLLRSPHRCSGTSCSQTRASSCSSRYQRLSWVSDSPCGVEGGACAEQSTRPEPCLRRPHSCRSVLSGGD
jgi:hypothetical protein